MKLKIIIFLLLTASCFGQSLLLFDDDVDTTPPNAPTNLAAVGGSGEVVFTWTDPTNTDLDSIIVFGGTSANPTTPVDTIDAGVESYTKDGLGEGVIYYARLKAQDIIGNLSVYSNEVYDTTTVTYVPLYYNTGGNLTSWSLTKEGGNDITVASSGGNPDSTLYVSFDGTNNGIKGEYTVTASDTGWLKFDFYYSSNFFIPQYSTTNCFGFFNTTTAAMWFGLHGEAGDIGDKFTVTVGGTTDKYDTEHFAMGAWHTVILAYLNGGAGAGEVRSYIDGGLVSKETGLTLTQATFNRLTIGTTNFGNYPAITDYIKIDNIIYAADSLSLSP